MRKALPIIAFVLVTVNIVLFYNSIKDRSAASGGRTTYATNSSAFSQTRNNQMTVSNQAAQIVIGKMDGEKQTVEVGLTGYGYEPTLIIVQKDIETEFKFSTSSQPGCDAYVVFPQLEGYIDLTKTNAVTVTPTEDFTIQCTMAMYGVTVKVVDDINGPEAEQLRQEATANPETYRFQGSRSCGGGCCG